MVKSQRQTIGGPSGLIIDKSKLFESDGSQRDISMIQDLN